MVGRFLRHPSRPRLVRQACRAKLKFPAFFLLTPKIMRLQEIPALPFNLDIQSVTEWLDQLPVANIRECCRLLFPVTQALTFFPMAPRLRFEIFEKCHPIIIGVARDLQNHIIDRAFRLDAKSAKIMSLPARFHIEAADGYRQLVESSAPGDTFSVSECALILRRALEHLGFGLLRAAQTYDFPSSSIESSLNRLYRYAVTNKLLDETTAPERERASSAYSLFARLVFFRLMAPGRLPQDEIQYVFNQLIDGDDAAIAKDISEKGSTGREVFFYDQQDINVMAPAWSTMPPVPGLPYFSPEVFRASFRVDLRSSSQTISSPLVRALSRIGERLPCQDQGRGGRRAALSLGVDSVLSMVREVETRRETGFSGADPWSLSRDLELATEELPQKFLGLQSLATALSETEAEEGKRRIVVTPTDVPGFYLLDSEKRAFRSGQILGMNSDGQSIQLAVFRCGQIRDGRFWHSIELLGTQVSSAQVNCEGSENDSWPALLLDEDTEEPTLVVAPIKWRRDTLIVTRLTRKKRIFRIGNLLEATPDFYQYALAEATSEKPGV